MNAFKRTGRLKMVLPKNRVDAEEFLGGARLQMKRMRALGRAVSVKVHL
ncbi:MAG: hypothetical protein NPIRA06_32350 [Nitrospirales bacterium]|nr:MAG: hypothetical protein NPIRA06_32350 [Nitrospirales bacterium]